MLVFELGRARKGARVRVEGPHCIAQGLRSSCWARAVKMLPVHSMLLKSSVRKDEAEFTKQMFAQARRDGDSCFHGLIRAVLKTGRRYRAPQLSPSLRVQDRVVNDPRQVRVELGKHFARAEKADEVQFHEVWCPQHEEHRTLTVEASGMPTLAQVASAFAGMRSRRAPGVSGLPADIFKVCPVASAQLHAPLYLKILARGRAPVLWRGCLVTNVPKPGKPQHLLSGHRSIALQEPASKALAKSMRSSIARALDTVAPPGMSGGRKNKPISIPAMTVQAHLAKLKRLNRSGGILFIDGTNAFYSAARAFLFKAPDEQGLNEWVQQLPIRTSMKERLVLLFAGPTMLEHVGTVGSGRIHQRHVAFNFHGYLVHGCA